MKKILIVLAMVLLFATPALAANVSLAWDPVTATDLAGYRVYQSNQSGVYDRAANKAADIPAGTTEVIIDVTPEDGRTVYFVATAYDQAGNESGYSKEVFWTVPDTVPPNAPGGFRLNIQMSINNEGQMSFKVVSIEKE